MRKPRSRGSAAKEAVVNRYRLTGKLPRTPQRREILTGGWTSTDLIMQGALVASRRSADGSFLFVELVDAVRQMMLRHDVRFQGVRVPPRGRRVYKDDAERIVCGRFGDLHRLGVFARVTSRPARGRRAAAPADLTSGVAQTVRPSTSRLASAPAQPRTEKGGGRPELVTTRR